MTQTKARILAVDDEAENITYLRRVLGRKYEMVGADSGQAALEIIRAQEFAVLLADHRMPGMSGVEFLTVAKNILPDAVRIILTGFAELDDTVDAINRAGVSWYLRKPIKPQEIEHAVGSAVEIHLLRLDNHTLIRTLEERNRQLEEQERLLILDLDQKSVELLRINQRLEELAVRDGLTGLFNHRYFQERTEQEIKRAERYGHALSLVFLDLDYFKVFNDLNGHPKGDLALLAVAETLKAHARDVDVLARMRGTDIVARYGGEEFVVLTPETDSAGAMLIAERIRQVIEHRKIPWADTMPDGRLTISGGVASYPKHATTRSELIQRADEALYRAKARGRNQICLFEHLPTDDGKATA